MWILKNNWFLFFFIKWLSILKTNLKSAGLYIFDPKNEENPMKIEQSTVIG